VAQGVGPEFKPQSKIKKKKSGLSTVAQEALGRRKEGHSQRLAPEKKKQETLSEK
jgi:hypothetical protein